jgi:hypothetical protein
VNFNSVRRVFIELTIAKLVSADFHAVFFRRLHDASFYCLDFAIVIFCGVIYVIDVIPGGANVFGRINRIFVIRHVGKFYVAVFTLAFFGINVISLVYFAD